MLYAVICRDKPGALEIRKATREAHLAYIQKTGIVDMAGPLIEGGQMAGSLVILKADSADQALAWTRDDPYAHAGLFQSVEVIEWKKVIG